MADISGPGGNFTTVSGFVAHFSGWSATLNITTVENTGFAEVGARTYLPTAYVMTGSAVGTGETGSAPVAGAGLGATPAFSSYTGNMTLTAASGDTYEFVGVVDAVALSRPHDGKLDVSLTFRSSGPITQAWS